MRSKKRRGEKEREGNGIRKGGRKEERKKGGHRAPAINTLEFSLREDLR